MSLTQRLKAASADAHGRAEKHPFLNRLFAGELEPVAYLAYLGELKSVYQTLERNLQKAPTLRAIADAYGLRRSEAIAMDLQVFRDRFALSEAPLPSPDSHYAEHLSQLSKSWPIGLVAHFYTRYLGDLSGGQILRRFVQKCFRLPDDDGVSFYHFAAIETPRKAVVQIKAALDSIELSESEIAELEGECRCAFQLSEALFDAGMQPAKAGFDPVR